jgi:integrase
MSTVDTHAKVVIDNAGFQSEIPVLLTSQGVVTPVLNYLLTMHNIRSYDWQCRVVRATKLLVAYMEANEQFFTDPRTLFQNFATRLYSGTVGDDGMDPSGLYWIPASTALANKHLSSLRGLTDYLADNQDTDHMNPLMTASSHDQRLNYAAWFRRNQNDFLGHIKNKSVSDIVSNARNVRGRRKLGRIEDDAVAFPENLFERFYMHGLGSARDRRCVVRDQLITIMMHGAGLRESEPLHLYVQDVTDDRMDDSKVIVRVYHPEDGKAPDGWKSRTGKTNRSAYLREMYALPPRNKLRGTQRVGWKPVVVDHKDGYLQLHWFSPKFAQLFRKLWDEHLLYLANIERLHPYAFISYEKLSLGKPYTLNAFNVNYAAAMARINLITAKVEGRSPHGHRHAYGRRLTRAGIDPMIRKKAMHHFSLESQIPYTTPGFADVNQAFSQAAERIEQSSTTGNRNQPFSNWDDLLNAGFEDVDPSNLFSGPSPKLRKN